MRKFGFNHISTTEDERAAPTTAALFILFRSVKYDYAKNNLSLCDVYAVNGEDE